MNNDENNSTNISKEYLIVSIELDIHLFHFIYERNIQILHFWDHRKGNLPTSSCVGFVNISLSGKSPSSGIGNVDILNDVNSFCAWTCDWDLN
jgi:hypothetical protein